MDELWMLSLVSRCEGGMRTSDLHVWDWTMLDLASSRRARSLGARRRSRRCSTCRRRSVRFCAWWERAGRPAAVPSFPCGGQARGQGEGAWEQLRERLRRDLFRAGIVRMAPVEVPARTQGMRTDLGKRTDRTMLAPNPRDPLYFETPTSLPVDFHSFRRAFNTALADAGVNVQKAMRLAGHSDAATHMGYVGRARDEADPGRGAPAAPRRGNSWQFTAGHGGSGSIRGRGGRRPTTHKPRQTMWMSHQRAHYEAGVGCSNHAGRAGVS